MSKAMQTTGMSAATHFMRREVVGSETLMDVSPPLLEAARAIRRYGVVASSISAP
jgi:hypothetical protein